MHKFGDVAVSALVSTWNGVLCNQALAHKMEEMMAMSNTSRITGSIHCCGGTCSIPISVQVASVH
eukprot:429835-Pelagomonas_calceolata.AAC.9